MSNLKEPILLFDGVCNLCSSSVQFVLKHNKRENVRFASLQSEFGKDVLTKFNMSGNYIQSLVFVENGELFTKSDAAVKLSNHLNGAWQLGKLLIIVPSFIRDSIYDLIARNRYKWFGRSETCWIPQPKWQGRFLD